MFVAALIFCFGLSGALSRRNAIAVLMGVELMLNSVNINLLAFWRNAEVITMAGQVFAIIVITVAAAEAAVGLALIIAVYRNRHTVDVEDVDLMQL